MFKYVLIAGAACVLFLFVGTEHPQVNDYYVGNENNGFNPFGVVVLIIMFFCLFAVVGKLLGPNDWFTHLIIIGTILGLIASFQPAGRSESYGETFRRAVGVEDVRK